MGGQQPLRGELWAMANGTGWRRLDCHRRGVPGPGRQRNTPLSGRRELLNRRRLSCPDLRGQNVRMGSARNPTQVLPGALGLTQLLTPAISPVRPVALEEEDMVDNSTIQVAIIGAGLAGLTAAYRLHQAGVSPAVFEANPERVCGRCWTARNFKNAQTGEHGGERLDTRHHEILHLVQELGLQLDDHSPDGAPEGRMIVTHGGTSISVEDMIADRMAVKEVFQADMERRGISYGGLPPESLSDAAVEL